MKSGTGGVGRCGGPAERKGGETVVGMQWKHFKNKIK